MIISAKEKFEDFKAEFMMALGYGRLASGGSVFLDSSQHLRSY
jgi:hypothetical protein